MIENITDSVKKLTNTINVASIKVKDLEGKMNKLQFNNSILNEVKSFSNIVDNVAVHKIKNDINNSISSGKELKGVFTELVGSVTNISLDGVKSGIEEVKVKGSSVKGNFDEFAKSIANIRFNDVTQQVQQTIDKSNGLEVLLRISQGQLRTSI